jgi:hypothetical protein
VQVTNTTTMASSDSIIDWNEVMADDLKYVFQLAMDTDLTNNNIELVSKVSTYSQSMGENNNRGSITLVDPTPDQLGLCYASCLKTDRSDGLFTTVVCTRSNEALGLVYSSKVNISLFGVMSPPSFSD